MERPNERLSISVNGTEKELFASFLRQNAVLRVIGEPENLGLILIEPDVIETILKIFLCDSPRLANAMEVELDEKAISTEDVERVLTWVQEHMTYFFAKRLQMVQSQAQALESVATVLKSSRSGSEVSTSNDPSAGPSE